MKKLNNYINEALIKKDTKIDVSFDINKLKEEIFEYLTINEKYKNESLDLIENWIIDNHVENIEYILAPSTLTNIISSHYHDNDNVKYNNYNYNYKEVKKCEQKLNSSYDEIYKLNRLSKLYFFDDMIAHIFFDGTIYCIKK
jgi:hypothetical protein